MTVNFSRRETSPRKKTFAYKMPERRKLDLVFSSKSEFNEAVQISSGMAGATAGGAAVTASEPGGPPPTRPPRTKNSPLGDLQAGGNKNN